MPRAKQKVVVGTRKARLKDGTVVTVTFYGRKGQTIPKGVK